jgi:hypothetical protein
VSGRTTALGGQADVEVVGGTEEVGGTEALGQPATQEGRDLADLSVLQAQLGLGIAAGECKPGRAGRSVCSSASDHPGAAKVVYATICLYTGATPPVLPAIVIR